MSANGPEPVVDGPPRRGRFMASQALLWCLAALLLGVAAARAAVWIERVRAPWLIFPLLIGCGLGAMLVLLMHVAETGHRPTVVIAAALAALAAVAGQHYFSYHDYVQARTAFLEQQRSFVVPEELTHEKTFAEYMQAQAAVGRPIAGAITLRGPAAWASWALDGLLVLTSAVAVVYVFSKRRVGQASAASCRPTFALTFIMVGQFHGGPALASSLVPPYNEIPWRESLESARILRNVCGSRG